MSLFDRTLNAASAAGEQYQRAQRRRALEAQIAEQQAVIEWAFARIGQIATAPGSPPLPPGAVPAAQAAAAWQHELAQLAVVPPPA